MNQFKEQVSTLQKFVEMGKMRLGKLTEHISDFMLDLQAAVGSGSAKFLQGPGSAFRTSEQIENSNDQFAEFGVIAIRTAGVWFITDVQFLLTNEGTTFSIRAGGLVNSPDVFMQDLFERCIEEAKGRNVVDVERAIQVVF
jgi:hypothetical protein